MVHKTVNPDKFEELSDKSIDEIIEEYKGEAFYEDDESSQFKIIYKSDYIIIKDLHMTWDDPVLVIEKKENH